MTTLLPPVAAALPLADQFGELTALVEAVIAAVQAGDSVDLGGLDSRAEELCRAARSLEPDQVTPVAEAMRRLIEGLDRLQTVLPDPQAGPQAEAQRAAAAAYGRPTPSKP
jgi:hypothetical protein